MKWKHWRPGDIDSKPYWEKLDCGMFNNDHCWPGWYPDDGEFPSHAAAKRFRDAYLKGNPFWEKKHTRIVKVSRRDNREIFR